MPDIGEREAMTSGFGRLLGMSVVPAWVVPADQFRPADLPPDSEIIRDRCVVMPRIIGPTVEADQQQAKRLVRSGPADVADMFAFMHWIGDEDRGRADVMIEGERLVLIDNGLCGPGWSDRLRGAHPHPSVETQVASGTRFRSL